ncbi:MAG: FtsX-like permease family protein [Lachnospiraceae bacterium]|nr:FtsX-like permease family protein [Lachnospiraceae bacterium]
MRKNIVYYVTRQYMKMNKKRTFTAFLGIVFMVLLMTCVFIGKDTAVGQLEQVASQKDGKWHVVLYDITGKEREEVENLTEVEKTAVSVDYGFTEFAQSANKKHPYLNIKAYQKDCFDWMNIELKSGRLPENAKEVVISEAALEDGANITVGDTIKAEYFTRSITGINKEHDSVFPLDNLIIKYGETVKVPQHFPFYEENDYIKENRDYSGKKQELTVVGVIETPGYERSYGAGYTAIAMLDEKEITGLDQFNLSVKLDLEKLSSTYESTFQEIVGEHEIDFNDYVLAFSGKSSDSTLNLLISVLTIFFVAFIMFASVFLIYNLFNMSYEERSRYLGMLSSIGATGRQKRSSIYYEAFCLLIFALPAGILSGFGIVKMGMTVILPFLGKMMRLEQYIEGGSVTLMISWKAIVVIVGISAVTVLFSSYFPARKIGKIASIECIRGNADKKSKQYKMNRFMMGHGNAEWMLAGNTLKRQSKKTRAIIAASVTFIVIMLVTAFGSSVIQSTVEQKMGYDEVTPNYDKWEYIFSIDETKENENLIQEIKQAEGIAETVEWYLNFDAIVPKDCYSKEYWDDLHDIHNLYYHRKLSDKEFDEMIASERRPKVITVIGVEAKMLEKIAKATNTDLQTLENTDKPAAIVVQAGTLSTEQYNLSGMSGMEAERARFYDVKQMTDKKIGETLPVELYSEKEDKTVSFPIQIAGYANNEQLSEFMSVHGGNMCIIVSVETAKQIGKVTENSDGTNGMVRDVLIKTAEKKSGNPGQPAKFK